MKVLDRAGDCRLAVKHLEGGELFVWRAQWRGAYRFDKHGGHERAYGRPCSCRGSGRSRGHARRPTAHVGVVTFLFVDSGDRHVAQPQLPFIVGRKHAPVVLKDSLDYEPASDVHVLPDVDEHAGAPVERRAKASRSGS